MTLDLNFLHRVYRTSLALILFGGLLIWARFGEKAVLGWVLGAALSLSAVAVFEWTVRRYMQPGAYSPGRMAAVSLGKMLVLMAVIFMAFVAAKNGWLNLVWVLPGFALPHIVILLKLVGVKVLSATGARKSGEGS